MKKLAIILSLLAFTPCCVFAMDAPNYDVDSVTNTSDGLFTDKSFTEKLETTAVTKESLTEPQTTTYERKINVGKKPPMDKNTYWNMGGVKFGTGGAFKNGSSLSTW